MAILDRPPTKRPDPTSSPASKWWPALLIPVLLGGLVVCLPLMMLVSGSGGGTGGCAAALGVATDNGPLVAGLDTRQQQIAATIIARGVDRGLPGNAEVIAVATAQDESGFRNYANPTVPESMTIPHVAEGSNYDSVGVFQQRPSQGWGSVADLMNPTIATDKFYDALQRVPNWQTMSVPDAAAAVQHNLNGAGDYARYEASARQIVAALGGAADNLTAATGCGGAGQIVIPGFDPSGPANLNIVAAAASQTGVTYAWGGGDITGPTQGKHDGGVGDAHGDYTKVGWDCSGLAQWAVYRATGRQIPRSSQLQSLGGDPVADEAAAIPGDLVFFGGPGVAHHVGVYVGGGWMIDSLQSGDPVKLERLDAAGAGPITFRRYSNP
jgi:cell wall-associated NlpC family hydrolase